MIQVRVKDVRLWDANYRHGDIDMIAKSIQRFGYNRSVSIWRDSVVIAGNHTIKALQYLESQQAEAPKNVEIINGDWVIHAHDVSHLSDIEAEAYAIADNRASDTATNDDAQLGELLRQIQATDETLLDATGYSENDLTQMLDFDFEVLLDEDEGVFSADVPDALFPSNNEYGIPTLLLDMQADFLDMPIIPWGQISRKSRMQGTYHFYIEDFKFTALWKDPTPIINSRCISIIEPNFSTNPYQPRAVAIWDMYRKRWLSRYWQENGVRVVVDLNVSPNFVDLAFMGVPRGWGAYGLRASAGQADFVTDVFKQAKAHADGNKTLFVVYGGGLDYKTLCEINGWVWLPEYAHIKDGRYGQK